MNNGRRRFCFPEFSRGNPGAGNGVSIERHWKVAPWVRDADLEDVLNNATALGWTLVFAWRNTPASDGQETTTLVWMRQ